MTTTQLAPPWQISQWLNCDSTPTLPDAQGRVIVLHTFQMLCPGCVQHALPQAARIAQLFPAEQVCVLGLHSVFEHHAVMGPEALRVFLQEYRIRYPVGIDQPATGSPIPATMQAYAMQGTPTLVLIDRQGRRRLQHFGMLDDMVVGAEIMRLLCEPA